MYNRETIDDIVISLDVDWAPDFVLDAVSQILIKDRIKATWFVTHYSKGVQRLFDHQDLFEIGVHPNFMAGSSQGSNFKEVLDYVMNIAPKAKSIRTHGMVYSAVLSKMFAVEYGLKNDSSVFLGEMPHIIPQEVFYADKDILRVPYFWADDGEMSIKKIPSFKWNNKRFSFPGLKILDFHPIHIYLNSNSMLNYNNLKESYDLKNCIEADARKYINKENGAATLLKEIIKSNPNKDGFKTISETCDLWRKNTKGLVS